ncbi:MBL fold metallo-hydrolase [Streptomyces sp. NPDC101165]|uniref:MBL fold metallo-hydrolase n=1 Tax=Streptomyces sp. NPDC101165 TaxID=3366119 RepID=UPI00381D71FA
MRDRIAATSCAGRCARIACPLHPRRRGVAEAGGVPPEGRSGLPGRLPDRLPKLHWTPVAADGTLVDGDLVGGSGGLRVIHTPGHSPGHIVLRHEPSRTLLTGDAVFHRGRLDLGHAALAADPGLRADSLGKLPAGVRGVGLSHGAPLTGAGAETFRRFVESL